MLTSLNSKFNMVKKIFAAIILCLFLTPLNAQEEKTHIRKGNRQYDKENYTEAENQYRKASSINIESVESEYNLASALYRQEKFEEAEKIYSSLAKSAENKLDKAKAYHSLGNTYLQMQKLKEAIEAYKNALRNNPDDNETRYNLAFAMDRNRQQQQQQQKEQEQKKQEPSDYAKKIKKQAESLVAQRKYDEAYQLMKDAEKQDRSITSFNDFTERINEIIKINN